MQPGIERLTKKQKLENDNICSKACSRGDGTELQGRLRKLDLTTLERRNRGDMITTYKFQRDNKVKKEDK